MFLVVRKRLTNRFHEYDDDSVDNILFFVVIFFLFDFCFDCFFSFRNFPWRHGASSGSTASRDSHGGAARPGVGRGREGGPYAGHSTGPPEPPLPPRCVCLPTYIRVYFIFIFFICLPTDG